MIYRVILQPRAEFEIEVHAERIYEKSSSLAHALRWTRGIRAKIATLQTSPRRCPVDPDSAAYGEEVRVLLYGKRQGVHRVLFAIQGEEIHILTVRHAARRSLAEEMESGDPAEDDDPFLNTP